MKMRKSWLLFLLVASAFVGACSRHSAAPESQSTTVIADDNTGSDSGSIELPAAGPGEGGGGDPDTQEFIVLSRKLAAFFRENPSKADLTFTAQDFSDSVERLDKSIKDPAVTDLVEFTEQSLSDQNNVSKVALFNKPTFSIHVNRPYWNGASDGEKLVTITMEITGLMGAELRYEKARALVFEQTALILGMSIGTDDEKTPIGWRIANQDADLFARITENDVLIDGGIIGTGSKTNKRVQDFLQNPENDREWMTLARSAFAKKMPAFLILRDEAGQRASITGFRDWGTSVATYSLLMSSKSTPVGSCAHTATALSVFQRLHNCFFDTRFYDLRDSQASGRWNNAFAKLHEQLKNHFANGTTTLATAMQAQLLQDYSSLFPAQFRTHVHRQASLANGLKPTLMKGDTPFWETSNDIDQKSVRFLAALQAMAKDRVGLYPGHHPRCVTDEAGENLAPIDEPRIVQLAELRKIIETDTCLLQDTTDFESILYRALAVAGYIYDTSAKVWIKASPRVIPAELMRGQFRISRELETRFVTENLAGTAVKEGLEKALTGAKLIDRLALYMEVLPHWPLFGLSVAQAEAWHRLALKDVMSLKAGDNPVATDADIHFAIAPFHPLDEFLKYAIKKAVSNSLITAQISKDYVTGIVSSAALNKAAGYNLIEYQIGAFTEKGKNFPYAQESLSALIERPFFDQDLAADLARKAARPVYDEFAGNGRPLAYSVLSDLLNKTILSGKLRAEELGSLSTFAASLRAGAAFELEAHGLNTKTQTELLIEKLKKPEDAEVLADVIARFLLTHSVPAPDQEALFTALMEKGASLADGRMKTKALDSTLTGGVLPALVRLPYLLPMSENFRVKIAEYLVFRLKDKGANVQRAQEEYMYGMFDDKKPEVRKFTGAQRIFEVLAQGMPETKISVSRKLDLCLKYPTWYASCALITEPEVIKRKITASPN